MSRHIRHCLRDCGVKAWVYLDDLLDLLASVSASRLQRIRDKILPKPMGEDFLVSSKSELEPRESMTWVGKEVCRASRCINNTPSSLARCASFLLCGMLMGRLHWERLRLLLGRLQWLARLCNLF